MADEDTPQEAPEQAPEQDPNPNQAYEKQVMDALAQTDQLAQAVVDKILTGDLTEQEGKAQPKVVRDQATNAGVIYGQAVGGLQQVQGLLEEMGKAGADASTVKKFQRRVNKLYAGEKDAELAGDLVEEIRTGKPAIATPRTQGGKRLTDNELLLDPSTPMERVREIRKRQKAASGW